MGLDRDFLRLGVGERERWGFEVGEEKRGRGVRVCGEGWDRKGVGNGGGDGISHILWDY